MNFIRAIAVVWAATCLSTGAWIAYMVYDDVPPYVWDSGRPEGESFVDPDPAHQESMITVNWTIIKINRVCPANLQRFFFNHETQRLVTTLDTTEASRSVNIGDKMVPRSFQLPPNLPPLTDYQALACFECNAYQRYVKPLCIRTPLITFRVEPYPPLTTTPPWRAYDERVR